MSTGVEWRQAADGTLHLKGAVVFDTAPALADLPAAVPGEVLRVDWSGVTRVDSAAVALLLEWLRRLRPEGRSLQLENPPAALGNLLDLFDLEGLAGGA